MNDYTSNINASIEDEIFHEINAIIKNGTFLENNLVKKEDYFFNNFLTELKSFLDQDSFIYVCLAIKKYNHVLDELRLNNFSSADSYLCDMGKIVSDDYHIPNLIITTMANNVLAYKAYKYGDREEAFKLLLNSLEIDSLLEKQGFSLLHFHKIQTLHNIARTYLKQNLTSGIHLSLELMKYLSAKSGDFRLGKFIFPQKKNALSPKLCRELFLQILNDLIFHFINHHDENDIYYLEIFRKNLDTIEQKENYILFIEEWLETVLDLNKNTGTDSINSVILFLNCYGDKLACLSIFLIKKLLLIHSFKKEQIQKMRSDMSIYGFSI
ncbi:MAG: hypothetical protein ABI267_08780 [Ginsengibacter sp.]